MQAGDSILLGSVVEDTTSPEFMFNTTTLPLWDPTITTLSFLK
jgi:hypothetical protein